MSAPKLRCPKQRILFQFVEDTKGGGFAPRTDWGFEIQQPTDEVKAPRWAEVKVIGKDVKHVKPGDFILIESLMWTTNFTHEGSKYWATNEEKVIAVSEDRPTGFM